VQLASGCCAFLLLACAAGSSNTFSDDDVADGNGDNVGGAGGNDTAVTTGSTPGCVSSDQCADTDLCTDDICVDGQCTHQPVSCDDGVFCNGSEGCDSVMGCTAGTPPELDDGVPCTDDSCDEDSGSVVHTPDDTKCDDSSVCVVSAICDVSDDCVNVEEPVCANCTDSVHDNGAYDGVDGVAATNWNLDGIIDDFAWPGGDLCGIAFELFSDASISNEYQELRLRIYELPSGIAGAGSFNSATAVVDQVYLASDGSLVITDTGVDVLNMDVLTYETFGYTFTLAAGDYGIHLSFPDYVAAPTSFWPTSAPQGSGECAHVWGTTSGTPQDMCIAYGPQFDKLDFRLLGPI